MEDGVVVEQGSHQELMELEGAYYKLYISQSEQHKNDNGEGVING